MIESYPISAPIYLSDNLNVEQMKHDSPNPNWTVHEIRISKGQETRFTAEHTSFLQRYMHHVNLTLSFMICRTITHFRMSRAWTKFHGDPGIQVEFIRQLRDIVTSSQGPIVVHSAAGRE